MRTRTRPARLAAAAVALVVGVAALAGCRTGEPEPQAEPTPTRSTPEPTRSTAPAPTPEPTPSAEPDAGPPPAPAVNGPNSITAPLGGEQVPGPVVTVAGEGTAFEATLLYRVVRAGTPDVVAEGWTMAGANGEIGPYTFDVELDAGEYTVEVWEPDMSDGATGADRHNLVEVTFTVV